MLQLQNVSLSWGDKKLFEEISLSLSKGEKCALLGLNGCGKSSLMRAIKGEIEFDQGQVILPSHYKIGYLRQHEDYESPLSSVEFLLQNSEIDIPLWTAQYTLAGLGFSQERINQRVQELSGGYKIRLSLAKVLLEEPDILLLDEPTNYLDISSIEWLKGALKKLPGELLLISHDRGFVDGLCTSIMGIHRSQIYKVKGGTKDYYNFLKKIESDYESRLASHEKIIEKETRFIERFKSKATKAKQVQSRIKRLEKMESLQELSNIWQLDFDFKFPQERAPKRLIQVDNMSFSYEETSIIKDLNFEIARGEHWAIVGNNGAGKSTLLKLLLGRLVPTKGSVRKDSEIKIGYFGQTDIDLLSRFKNTKEAILDANNQLTLEEVMKTGALMGIDNLDRSIESLSGGERARVLLASILTKECHLLVLDEPTHHLDIESTQALIDAANRFEGAVVIVLHDRHALSQLYLDNVVVMRKGSLMQERYRVFKGGFKEQVEAIYAYLDQSAQKENPSSEKSLDYDMRKKQEKKLRAIDKEINEIEGKIEKIESKIEAYAKRFEQFPGLEEKEQKKLIQEQKEQASYHQTLEEYFLKWEELNSLRAEVHSFLTKGKSHG